MMLSRYRHKNLVSLVGFCDEDEEKIIVYEYEFNGSLEKHLSSNTLTWVQRLKICIGVARRLEYLHNPLGTQQKVLHRDMKSANILLDHFWEAKISDFGLSKIGPANLEFTFLVSNVVGTLGYCDPLYAETGILTKESDVYSFGVVLYEIFCGRICIGKHDDEQRMDRNSLKTFSSIAYKCVQRVREEHPTMVHVLANIKKVIKVENLWKMKKQFTRLIKNIP
ncbi:receptor-like protein kinase HERK 1 [Tanacetum coccineum]